MAETKIKSQAINIDSIYPVGSIYISTVSTNPSNYFGGTWEAFGAGKTLVGLDSGDTAFDTVEETGGAKTHTLTVAEMPAHAHDLGDIYSDNTSGKWNDPLLVAKVNSNYISNTSVKPPTDNTGGGEAHNNLQPYIVTYFFKRTA